MDIIRTLFEMKDEAFAEFMARLTPSVEPNRIIGVRTPEIRKLAKGIEVKDAIAFLDALPHRYLEENLLHSALLSRFYREYDEALAKVSEFLPFVDNWAVCDTLAPPAFKERPDILYTEIHKWLQSGKIYTVRFGLICLMKYFLDENYRQDTLMLAAAAGGDYYIEMAAAWFFCEALVKRWDDAVKILEENTLCVFVHNKTIQKARESFRMSQERKDYLKTLKW